MGAEQAADAPSRTDPPRDFAGLIAVEKLLPWKAAANRGNAVLLLVLGLSVAFAPEKVRGLIVPDSAQGQNAMQSMTP